MKKERVFKNSMRNVINSKERINLKKYKQVVNNKRQLFNWIKNDEQ
jgi:hypothetical protein